VAGVGYIEALELIVADSACGGGVTTPPHGDHIAKTPAASGDPTPSWQVSEGVTMRIIAPRRDRQLPSDAGHELRTRAGDARPHLQWL